MSKETVDDKVSNASDEILRSETDITKGEFLAFVNLLAGHPSWWENNNIRAYLSAFAGAIDDIEGIYQNQKVEIPIEPSWKSFALGLNMASVYD